MTAAQASEAAKPPLHKRFAKGAIGAVALIVFVPPLAGVLFLVLQLLGDDSYDLSRFGLSDVPRAVMAVTLSGSAYGYIFGLLPALVAGMGVMWLCVSGRRVSLLATLACVLVGGIAGAFVGSPIVGATLALGIVVLMLGLVSLAWWVNRRFGLLTADRA